MALPPKNTAARAKDAYRVMLVDDSAVIRGLFTRTLEADPEIEVVASVGDGQMAINSLKKKPDVEVIVLDIEMPRMDGLTALPHLIEIDPKVSVIIASTLSTRNAEISLKAMDLGAKDYIPKPTTSRELSGSDEFKRELLEKIKTFAKERRRAENKPLPSKASFSIERKASERESRFAKPALAAAAASEIKLRPMGSKSPKAIAIGSSTGGPQALFQVLGSIPKTIGLPILLTQHMPATFTPVLAEHITRSTGWTCVEGVDGMRVEAGRVILAPGDKHMLIEESAGVFRVRLNQDPPENFCRPAVDPMLRSMTKVWRGHVLCVILTGMGSDGAKAAAQLVDAGGTVIAQDEASSVVWGMPGAVARAGVCSAVMPVSEIGEWVGRQTVR